ncbi:G2 mitotic-specific cyclin-B, putative [Babesia ovata]|uniref:G2 mitotic-specific cyclin-B, putative n=1 Tax=Babesia ovata TaxID=189622 RepID=A0A2H6KAM5_9APIC|nr:G2 mitotic-specific cyclin-B, putative [Babesia ovata]GBE60040.1 G2 mitotic-specific cyclin-B, putative [Babesia ovata]
MLSLSLTLSLCVTPPCCGNGVERNRCKSAEGAGPVLGTIDGALAWAPPDLGGCWRGGMLDNRACCIACCAVLVNAAVCVPLDNGGHFGLREDVSDVCKGGSTFSTLSMMEVSKSGLVKLREGLAHVRDVQQLPGEPGVVSDCGFELRERDAAKLEHFGGLAAPQRLEDTAKGEHEQVAVRGEQPLLDHLAEELSGDGELLYGVLGEESALVEEYGEHGAISFLVPGGGGAGVEALHHFYHLVGADVGDIEVVEVLVDPLFLRHVFGLFQVLQDTGPRGRCVGRGHHGVFVS